MTTTRSTWSPIMLDRLKRGLARGEKRTDIALALGLTPTAVHDKTRTLRSAGLLNVVSRKRCSRCQSRFTPDCPLDRRCRRCRKIKDISRSVCADCTGPCAVNATRCGDCHHRRQSEAATGVIMPERKPEPTAEMPGTLEKVAVMAARYLAGEALFHKLDARRTL